MNDHLNTVKTAAGKRGYHHGDLRAALISAAEAVLDKKGVSHFSLREAARRAGVSPAAPAHHFGDARGLLTAVAARGFDRLKQALEQAEAPAGRRLQALGAAYIAFARQSPALFTVMWARDLLDIEDPAYLSAGRAAFNVLERTAAGRDVPVATGPHIPDPAILAAWSMMHGFARLVLDGALGGLPETMERAVLDLLPLPAGRVDRR